MFLKPHSIALLLTVPLLLMDIGDSHARKLYRWVDDEGNVTFSDQVPPDQVQHKRETLNEKAEVVDVLERAKTPEERARLRRLEQLRQQQEKIIAKQAAADKVLLATYRNVEDIERALQNKLALMDSKQRAIEGNKQRFEQQLRQQQQQAANLERNTQKVPEKLLNDIASTEQQILVTEQELARHAVERQKIEREFKTDIARFEFLVQKFRDHTTDEDSLAISNANSEIGLFVCQDTEQCEKAWKIAAEFVYEYATTGPDVETDRLIMTAAPKQDSDFSLSASKLSQTDIQQIFLDIRCKTSNVGRELCNSESAQAIRRGFSAYIQSRLSSE